jgi:hypothetical protein
MTEREKLIIAIQQIDNLTKLLEGNMYECYMLGDLTPVRYELERQFSLLSNGQQND